MITRNVKNKFSLLLGLKIILNKKGIRSFVFFLSLFSWTIFLFKNAFSIDFFLDDFFFLKVGQATTTTDFLNFFSPFKGYFYRPIPTEVFYFFINSLHQNLFWSHAIVFVTYFIGIYFLYKNAYFLTKSYFFSYLFTFFYTINFIHVFQLYELATAIEIALFSFLTISLYFYLTRKYIISIIFFIFALLSKESAILFPVGLFVYELVMQKLTKKQCFKLMGYGLLAMSFVILYKTGTAAVIQLDTYKLQLNPRLIINNIVWYFLWGLGVPNFVPNYIQSIFFKPLPAFWSLFNSEQIRHYFYLFSSYYIFLNILLVSIFFRHRKQWGLWLILLGSTFVFFLLFISPTLPIIHRWMVRLTIPLVFVLMFQTYIIYKGFQEKGILRLFSIVLVVIYFFVTYLGVAIHESSGLFLMASQESRNARTFFTLNKEPIQKKSILYFHDKNKSIFGGSQELKNILGNQFFLDYYFPNQKKTAIYGFEESTIPLGAYIIEANDIISGKVYRK